MYQNSAYAVLQTPLTHNRIDQKATTKVQFSVESCDRLPNHQRAALDDICIAMQDAHSKNLQMELMIDKESRLWGATTPKNTALVGAPMTVTLDSLLLIFSQYSRKRWLAKEKAIFAVILSYSLLQLEGSQWLDKDWRAEHISFLRDHNVSPANARSC